MRWRALAPVVMASAVPLQAQTMADGLAQLGAPGWMTAWSPLAPLADLSQVLPTTGARPDLVGAPAPRIGLWWTAGSPAALPFEVVDRRSMFRGVGGWTDGTYRRALDPDDVTAFQASGLAWTPIASSGGAAATVLVDQEHAGALPYAATLMPYTTDPLVVTDTTIPARRRVRARVEAAFAWRVRKWGAGVALGVEESDERTLESRFSRLGRNSIPALRVGLIYAPAPVVRFTAYGRWIEGNETITLVPRTADGLAFLFAGYHDPDSLAVAQAAGLFRRSERSARAGGLAAAGRMMEADWVLFGERAVRHNRHFSARVSDPPTDRWDADGWTLGAGAQRPMGPAVLVTLQARYETLGGEATLAELEGVIVRASENALVVSGEVRYAPIGSGWTAVATGSLNRVHRIRDDFIVEVGADLIEWTPAAAVAVARDLGRTTVAVGASGGLYSAQGSIPDASQMGSVYQRVIAPGMALAATPARPLAATLTLGQRVGGGTTVLVDGAYAWLAPRAAAPLLFLPQGGRTTWSVGVRVVLAPPSGSPSTSPTPPTPPSPR